MVKATDKDQYREQFQTINSRLNTSIPFTQQNIKNLQIGSETIDFLYCISVVEHIPQKFFKQIIFELWRILKPSGRLILTMDIDYKNGGIKLIKELEDIIPGKFVFESIPNYILSDDVVNTHWIYDKFGTKLFPGSWKRRTKLRIPKLTVFCITLIKLGDRED
jgi:2-polyprenyl-3-methyl-5-hydroxy-6-metoxy-1,4-benzoquinol methylase